ncbi:MAG: gamma-glutamylcyclotransferase family protein [Sumerlaeia bacterium]
MVLPALKIFVYGTLKRGFANHHLMEGYAAVEDCVVVGGLLIPAHRAYPYLRIARADILAYGSADPLADLELQARIGRSMETLGGLRAAPDGAERFAVEGELYTYRDGREILPRLDALEEFHPGRPPGASNYHRVLARAGREGSRVAWVYIWPENKPLSQVEPAEPPHLWRQN